MCVEGGVQSRSPAALCRALSPPPGCQPAVSEAQVMSPLLGNDMECPAPLFRHYTQSPASPATQRKSGCMSRRRNRKQAGTKALQNQPSPSLPEASDPCRLLQGRPSLSACPTPRLPPPGAPEGSEDPSSEPPEAWCLQLVPLCGPITLLFSGL